MTREEYDAYIADRVGGVREGNVAVNPDLWPDLGIIFFVPLMPQDMVIRREDAERLWRCLGTALAPRGFITKAEPTGWVFQPKPVERGARGWRRFFGYPW